MKFETFKIPLLIFVAALFFYAYLFGWNTLNPTYTAWLWKGGISAQNYFGWAFFRMDPWLWPPGAIESFNISQKTSIGLTDAIPLWAFFFKLFKFLLPDTFQYLGWFLFSNVFLTGLFAYFIAKKITDSLILQLFFVLFLLLSPPFLFRLHWNPALSSHWLILASFLFYLSPWRFIPWAILIAVASLMHPYLLAMVMTILIFKLFSSKNIPFKKRLLECFLFFILSIELLYITGYFVGGGSLEDLGFGFNQLNLMGLLDGYLFNQPLLFFEWDLDNEEGSQYLGFGVILLALLAFILWLKNIKTHQSFFGKNSFSLWLCVILLTIFALATPIRFLNTELFSVPIYDMPLLKQLSGIFRASGRFGWPLFYLLNMVIFATLFKYVSKKILIILLSLTFIIQIVDLSPKLKFMHDTNHTYLEPLLSDEWQAIAKEGANVIVIPSSEVYQMERDNRLHITWQHYIPPAFYVAFFAYKNKMRTNYAHSSRLNLEEWHRFMNYHVKLLIEGKPAKNTIYVFFDEIPMAQLKELLPENIFKRLIVINEYPVLPICKNCENE